MIPRHSSPPGSTRPAVAARTRPSPCAVPASRTVPLAPGRAHLAPSLPHPGMSLRQNESLESITSGHHRPPPRASSPLSLSAPPTTRSIDPADSRALFARIDRRQGSSRRGNHSRPDKDCQKIQRMFMN
ncbi:hypothetical protein FHR81_003837 [Actinoalloteichus hoggarensis]|nr:hypothetical protein [Actinoalloteichus hoggarensis]